MNRSGRPARLAHSITEARAAWDDGRPTFVYRYAAPKGWDSGVLNEALNEIVEVGWQLTHFSTHQSTQMLNAEVAIAVFERQGRSR
jgi:hypothetical protein